MRTVEMVMWVMSIILTVAVCEIIHMRLDAHKMRERIDRLEMIVAAQSMSRIFQNDIVVPKGFQGV